MSEDLKIVIALKGPGASVGIQAPNCDPVFAMVKGDLTAVLQSVPGLVEEARRKWESNPRYPKCETKLEPQPAARVASDAPYRASRQAEEAMKPRLL